MIPVITIDGPSGSGKGTISRLVAQATGFKLLDSGALYRLTALASMRHGADITDAEKVAEIAAQLDVAFTISASGSENSSRVLLEQQDVTRDIRAEDVGMNASIVAAYPQVRQALLQRQREFGEGGGLVADGRDMGTVVFPDAPVKIFLTASAEERAKRRARQLQDAGRSVDYDRILDDIKARDYRDTSRATAPLAAAEDALLLDSTQLTIDEVLQAVLKYARSKGVI